MKKQIPNAPLLPEFRSRFLRVLESAYQADPLVARILKEQALREFCATLFWLTVNDCRDRLTRQTTQRHDFFVKALDDAIRGATAMEFVYSKLDDKPHLAEYLGTLRGDLMLKRQAVDTAFASPKIYGRDRDWFIVRYVKIELEARLQEIVTHAVTADLLNAANIAADRKPAGKKTEIHAADVSAALQGLSERTFERVQPYYRQLLSQHYPQGSDFPARH